MTRVLVTGATGFVGGPTCRALLAAGLDVRAAVRSRESAERLTRGVESLVVGDLAQSLDWRAPLTGVDAVVHLAARVHVMHDRGHDASDAYRRMNVDATEQLARAAATAGVSRFVYVSSVKAVAERSDAPLTEHTPPAPEDAYGRSKREAEDALRRLARETALGVAIVRPPLVYGPGVAGNFGRLLTLLRLASRVPLPLAGGQARSLVFVENLASALVSAATHPAAAGETFFVRDGRDVTTAELLRTMGQAIGLRPRLFHAPAALLRTVARLAGRGAEIERLLGALQVDDSHLRDALGWRPPVTVDDALTVSARALARDRA